LLVMNILIVVFWIMKYSHTYMIINILEGPSNIQFPLKLLSHYTYF
jgi:hypothetical protein